MAEEMWTVKRCLDWTNDYLARKGLERPRVSAEWLLTSVTGLSRIQLYTEFDRPLDPGELSRMHDAVVRRAKGEPLQYITGETTFRTIDVACEPGVLIPRPETEVLVDEVLAYLDACVLGAGAPAAGRPRAVLPWNDMVEERRREEREAAQDSPSSASAEADDGEQTGASSECAGEPDGAPVHDCAGCPDQEPGEEPAPAVARVLEVGCGTGVISLSLAAERPGRVRCVATDIEPRAVALTERNRDSLGLTADDVDVRLGNLVSPLDRGSEWGTFDVLVSNPPYIPTEVMGRLPREVADYEPELALAGGDDGLDIYRRLLRAAPHMLRVDGLFACELHEDALDAAAALARGAGLDRVEVVRDLAGRPRHLLARVPAALARAAAIEDGRTAS